MLKKKTEIKQKETHSSTSQNIVTCIQCGTCCRKGGPALHEEDKNILLAGLIERERLITLRKGELAFSPLSGRPEPIQKELVKLAGKGKGWVCCFYDEEKSVCTIYSHRPLECRLLKCWDTEELLAVIGKDTLTRADIFEENDPLLPFIEIHEKECSVEAAEDLIAALLMKHDDTQALAELDALVRRDLALRSKAISEFGLSLEAELFIFGRPLFKILSARGFQFIK